MVDGDEKVSIENIALNIFEIYMRNGTRPNSIFVYGTSYIREQVAEYLRELCLGREISVFSCEDPKPEEINGYYQIDLGYILKRPLTDPLTVPLYNWSSFLQ